MSEVYSSSDSGSHGASSPDTRDVSHLKFSIDNILSPEFGISKVSLNDHGCTSSALNLLSATNLDFINNAVEDMEARQQQLPAWIYCTRYSDRPRPSNSGSRQRKAKRKEPHQTEEEKRPRTAFTSEQLECLKQQFHNNRYLTEKRRQELAHELGLNESQIKIWFQNKRAKLKKATLQRASNNNLTSTNTPNAYQLMNLYSRLGLTQLK